MPWLWDLWLWGITRYTAAWGCWGCQWVTREIKLVGQALVQSRSHPTRQEKWQNADARKKKSGGVRTAPLLSVIQPARLKMPSYLYRCDQCGAELEMSHPVRTHGDAAPWCCSYRMMRVFSAPSIIFKGTGWGKDWWVKNKKRYTALNIVTIAPKLN